MYESKKLMWEVDVVGDENENVAEIVKAFLNRDTQFQKSIASRTFKIKFSNSIFGVNAFSAGLYKFGKESRSSHELKIVNSYTFATSKCKPLIFQT